jgi:hypothetical protein
VPDDKELAEMKRDAERFLRDQGFSRKMATQCASNLFQGFGVSEMLEEKPEVEAPIKESAPVVTPVELEVLAGLASVKERMLLNDLDKSFRKYFS